MKKHFALSVLTLAFSMNLRAQIDSSESSETRSERVPAGTDFSATAAPVARTPAQIEQDREVMERAKARRYKGGAEEGELRVQAQLAKAQRKIAPVVDRKENDKDTQDHD